MWTTRGDADGLPAVGLACAEDPLLAERFEIWAVEIGPAAKVCEIHGPGDWARVAAAHPRDVTESRRHDWHRWTGYEGPWILPDWRSVVRQWDGVHVSVGGYLSTAGMRVDAGGAATLLVGWDANQTLWLNDVFTSVRQLGTWEGTPGREAIPLTSGGRPTTARTSGSPRRRRDKKTILPRLHDVTADRRGGLSPSREPGGTIQRRTLSPPDAAWPARFTADLPTDAELSVMLAAASPTQHAGQRP